MINWIKNLFTGTPVPTPVVDTTNAAPYKVPEPAAITPIPLVVTPKKKPAVKKTPAKKTVAKAPAKRGRKPKTGV